MKRAYTILLVGGGAIIACTYIILLLKMLAGRDFLNIAVFPILHIAFLEVLQNKLLVISGMFFGALLFLSLTYLARLVPRFLLSISIAATSSIFLYGINHLCGSDIHPICFGQKSAQIESGPFILMMMLGAFTVFVIGNIVLLCYKLILYLLNSAQ